MISYTTTGDMACGRCQRYRDSFVERQIEPCRDPSEMAGRTAAPCRCPGEDMEAVVASAAYDAAVTLSMPGRERGLSVLAVSGLVIPLDSHGR